MKRKNEKKKRETKKTPAPKQIWVDFEESKTMKQENKIYIIPFVYQLVIDDLKTWHEFSFSLKRIGEIEHNRILLWTYSKRRLSPYVPDIGKCNADSRWPVLH